MGFKILVFTPPSLSLIYPEYHFDLSCVQGPLEVMIRFGNNFMCVDLGLICHPYSTSPQIVNTYSKELRVAHGDSYLGAETLSLAIYNE